MTMVEWLLTMTWGVIEWRHFKWFNTQLTQKWQNESTRSRRLKVEHDWPSLTPEKNIAWIYLELELTARNKFLMISFYLFILLHLVYLFQLTSSSHSFSHYMRLRPQCELIFLYKEVGRLQRRRWLLHGWVIIMCYRFCAHPESSPESNSVQIPQKSFGGNYINRDPRFGLECEPVWPSGKALGW